MFKGNVGLFLGILMCASCVSIEAADRKSNWQILATSAKGFAGIYFLVTGIKDFYDMRPRVAIAIAIKTDGDSEGVEREIRGGSIWGGIFKSSMGLTLLYSTYRDIVDNERSPLEEKAGQRSGLPSKHKGL